MSNLACRVAPSFCLLRRTSLPRWSRQAPLQPSPAAGFDFSGADFANKPGDDFFPLWQWRLSGPPSSRPIAVRSALIGIEYYQRGPHPGNPRAREEGVALVAGGAIKISAFWRHSRWTRRAPRLDVEPIASHLNDPRAPREEVAGLVEQAGGRFFGSVSVSDRC
jgi:hypothetical protein